MRLSAAWRNTSSKRTTGIVSELMRSASDLPRSDGRQLVDVADEEQCRAAGERAHQGAHEQHVNHAGLVNDEQIALERRVLVAFEAAAGRVGFEKAMDGLGFEAGALRKAFGRAPGRCAGLDARPFRPKYGEDRLEERGLAHAGTARHHENLRGDGKAYGLALARRQGQSDSVLDPRDRALRIDRRPRCRARRDRAEALGDLALGVVEAGEEDAACAADLIGDDAPLGELEAERRFDQIRGNFE